MTLMWAVSDGHTKMSSYNDKTMRTLIAFPCTHYKFVSEQETPNLNEELTELVQSKSASWTNTLPPFVQMLRNCSRERCAGAAGIDTREMQSRLWDAISQAHRGLDLVLQHYKKAGKQYHNTLPVARVRLLKDPRCILAHQQFVAESRPAAEDPFFGPCLEAREILDVAADMLVSMEFGTWTDAVAREILTKVNQARSLVAKAGDEVTKLIIGVETIQQTEGESRIREKGVIKPGKTLKHAVQAPSAVQRHLFEANTFRKWSERVKTILDKLPTDSVGSNVPKLWRIGLVMAE